MNEREILRAAVTASSHKVGGTIGEQRAAGPKARCRGTWDGTLARKRDLQLASCMGIYNRVGG